MHKSESHLVKLTKFNMSRARNSSSQKLSYKFNSIFAPSNTVNLSLYLNNALPFNSSSQKNSTFRNDRIIIKQSYLLLAWIARASKANRVGGFSSLPKKRYRFTATKAPMAHKTFSQEQFALTYYRLTVNVRSEPLHKCDNLTTLLRVTNFHSGHSNIGTNMLFLSKVTYSVASADNDFLTLH